MMLITAMRTAMPKVTCGRMTLWLPSATDESISTPRLIGVEIDSAVVDGRQSVILPQVTFGIAVRMAVMSIVAGNEA